MTDNKSPKPFDQVWEDAEKISSKQYENQPRSKIVEEITALLNDYLKTENIEMEEIKKSLRNRYLGELIYLITALSFMDNVNVYTALQQEIIVNEIV